MTDYTIVRADEAEDAYAGSEVPGEFRSLKDALGAEQLAVTLIRVPPHSDFEQGSGHHHEHLEEIYILTRGTLTMRFDDQLEQVPPWLRNPRRPRNHLLPPQRGRRPSRALGNLPPNRRPRRDQGRGLLGALDRSRAESSLSWSTWRRKGARRGSVFVGELTLCPGNGRHRPSRRSGGDRISNRRPPGPQLSGLRRSPFRIPHDQGLCGARDHCRRISICGDIGHLSGVRAEIRISA